MEKFLNIDYDQYKNLVKKICREIAISNFKPDYIVGITRGGLLPGVLISHYFNVPLRTISISLRDHINVNKDVLNEIKDKNLLIVDDINDTGDTINCLLEDWYTAIHKDTVKFCVIVDNLSSHSLVKMDYVGLEINKKEDDVWVNFPYEDWWAK